MKITSKKAAIKRITIRIPASLHAEIEVAAQYNGNTVNGEVTARLQAAHTDDRLEKMARDIAELKAMMREVLDKS